MHESKCLSIIDASAKLISKQITEIGGLLAMPKQG